LFKDNENTFLDKVWVMIGSFRANFFTGLRNEIRSSAEYSKLYT